MLKIPCGILSSRAVRCVFDYFSNIFGCGTSIVVWIIGHPVARHTAATMVSNHKTLINKYAKSLSNWKQKSSKYANGKKSVKTKPTTQQLIISILIGLKRRSDKTNLSS